MIEFLDGLGIYIKKTHNLVTAHQFRLFWCDIFNVIDRYLSALLVGPGTGSGGGGLLGSGPSGPGGWSQRPPSQSHKPVRMMIK